MYASLALSLLPLLAAHVQGQSQYGENQRGTIKDSDIVAQAFPDVEGIELLSPAFLRPDSTPLGWVNGTDGPTDDAEMGKHVARTTESGQADLGQITFIVH